MSRGQAQMFLFDTARLPIDDLSPEVRDFLFGLRECSPHIPDQLRVAEQPEQIMLVVVGGVGMKSTFVQTWGGTTRAVTRLIADK
jgi:hypothetical protein